MLAPVDAEGNLDRPYIRDEPLDQAFFPAASPIYFMIGFAELPAPGVYALDVTAERENGGLVSLPRVLFRHAR